MREAARLTRAGRFAEATAIVQRAMQSASDPHATESDPSPHGREEIIEGDFEVVDEDARAPADPQPVSPDEGDARAAHFIGATYTNQAGTRDYKLFVPSRRAPGMIERKPALIVMLHGCGQDPDDFAAGTRLNLLAEQQGFLVLYPAQSLGANGSGCWNWYDPEHQLRDQGEPSIIAGMTRRVMDSHGIAKGDVFIAGFSAGGAMAATMAANYPDLFSALGVHSGLPHAAARDMVSAMAVMSQGVAGAGRGWDPAAVRVGSLPVIVFQGDADMTVHPSNASQILAQFQPLDRRVEHLDEGGQRGLGYRTTRYLDAFGGVQAELWMLEGAGHGWSGGSPAGSFTEPLGPDASGEMVRFFGLSG